MKFQTHSALYFLFSLLIFNIPIYGQLKIPQLIGNGMVLQHESEFKIQGWVEAKNTGNKIIVSGIKVLHPGAVRYAWADNPEGANLFNKEGLPASPF